MLTVELDPRAEQRVLARAKSSGLPAAEFLRMLIESSLDDFDDVEMAMERLENPLPPLSSDQARKSLGLDD